MVDPYGYKMFVKEEGVINPLGSIQLKLECVPQNKHPFYILDDSYFQTFEIDKDTSMFEALPPNPLTNLGSSRRSSHIISNSATQVSTSQLQNRSTTCLNAHIPHTSQNTSNAPSVQSISQPVLLNNPSTSCFPQDNISIPSSLGRFTLTSPTQPHENPPTNPPNQENLWGDELDINTLHSPIFITPFNISSLPSTSQNSEGVIGNGLESGVCGEELVGNDETGLTGASIVSPTHQVPSTSNFPPITSAPLSISSTPIHQTPTIPRQNLVSYKGRKRGSDVLSGGSSLNLSSSSSSKSQKKLQIKRKIVSLKKELLDLELALAELD